MQSLLWFFFCVFGWVPHQPACMLAHKSCTQRDHATRWVVLSPYCTIAVIDRTQPCILQYSPTSCCPRMKYCWAKTTRMNFLWYSTRCTDYIASREFNTVPHSFRFTNSSSQAPNQSNIIGLLANVGQHVCIYIYVYMLHISYIHIHNIFWNLPGNTLGAVDDQLNQRAPSANCGARGMVSCEAPKHCM